MLLSLVNTILSLPNYNMIVRFEAATSPSAEIVSHDIYRILTGFLYNYEVIVHHSQYHDLPIETSTHSKINLFYYASTYTVELNRAQLLDTTYNLHDRHNRYCKITRLSA